MKPGHPTSERRRPFHIVRGGGRYAAREAEQLDRFLCDPDPLLVASLRKDENGLRRKKLGWGLALLLGLAAVLPSLWLSDLLRAAELESRISSVDPDRQKASPDRQKALLLIEQGRELMAKDRYNEALASFTLATRLTPDSADAWTELAGCQLKNYQSELAEKAFGRALALEPESTAALQGLGNLYLRRGEQHKAEAAWLRGGLSQQLARLYLLQGRFHEAESRLAPLLGGDAPGNDLLDRMAQAAKSHRLDSGLRSLLEPEPTGLSSWADLGWRLSKRERYEEAASAFGKALARVPHDVNALSGMGGALLALDRTQEAKAYFERALRLDNDHVHSLNGLASCLKNEGRIGEALTVWRDMSQRYPGVNYGTPGLAWTYYELGDYNEAAIYFAQLVRRYPYDSRVIDALNVAVENISSPRSY
ncbi:MAG TPA: tetratricopeptide repeat protein [Thermoanaerobaculia bacterium]|nr:tetratricopeptide repeat protein [Thermoanaerobaculia bacterium]